MAKHSLKTLRYSHCNIFEVCLVIFQHHTRKSQPLKALNLTNNKNSGVRSAGSRSSHYATHFGYNDIIRDGILHPRKMEAMTL